jgi:hypothetical protein
MYFWRIEALKADLRRADLNERGAFAYLLASMLAFTFFSNPEFAENSFDAPWNWLTTLGSMAIVVGGTCLAFRANRGVQGRQFLQRYFALGWVLAIRLGVFFFPPLVLLYGVVALSSGEEGSAAAGTLLVCVALWSGLFYWRLAAHLRDVAGAVDGSGGAPSDPSPASAAV